MMDRKEFAVYVQQHIKEFYDKKEYPQGTEAIILEIDKGSGRTVTGLVLKKPDEDNAPCIHLEDYYMEYRNGKRIENIMEEIAEVDRWIRGKTSVPQSLKEELSFEAAYSGIYLQVCDTEKSRAFLAERPHTEVGDLSAVYQIRYAADGQGAFGMDIKNELFESWGITLEELHGTALSNMQENFPTRMYSMEEMLFYLEWGLREPVDLLGGAGQAASFDAPFYVLTNEGKFYGAACLFDEEALYRASIRLGGNFFLLPSSRHDMLAVPEGQAGSYEELAAMVREINRTKVAPEDFLSDKVQYYDRERKQVLGEKGYLEYCERQRLREEEKKLGKKHCGPKL